MRNSKMEIMLVLSSSAQDTVRYLPNVKYLAKKFDIYQVMAPQ